MSSDQEDSGESHQRVFMLTFPPSLSRERERQRPLPRNVLRRPSVSVAAAVGERQWRQKNRFLPNNPPVSIWANRCLWTWWFKDGLLWKRPRPAMRRHQFRFERTSLPLFSLLLSRATWNWFSWAFLDIYTVHWFYSSLWNTKDI